MIGVGVHQDNTWLVVDPIVGCAFDCQYCFMRSYGKTNMRGEEIMTPAEAVERLTTYWAFNENSIPMIGSETDMFSSHRNVNFLTEFVQIYDQSGVRNPLCVSTKARIPDKFIELAQNLTNTKIIFYISYSGLPKEIEPYINPENLRDNFQRLSASGQRIIHFLRPMMPQNSKIEVLEKIFRDVYEYADCTVVRGLNLNPRLQKLAWYWPELRDSTIDFTKVVSNWPENLNGNLHKVMENLPNYRVYFKNSCALSYVLQIPDFVSVYQTKRCLSSWCPDSQRKICGDDFDNRIWPTHGQIGSEFERLGIKNEFEIDSISKIIKVQGTINHEQVAHLSQLLRSKIDVEAIKSDHEWGGYVLGHIDQTTPSSIIPSSSVSGTS